MNKDILTYDEENLYTSNTHEYALEELADSCYEPGFYLDNVVFYNFAQGKQKEVYCPMCDDLHANNTYCQGSWEE
jgi:hypothetical protein